MHNKLIIQQLIAHVDQQITLGINSVLHHSEFKNLEAVWRGMWVLVEHAHTRQRLAVKIKLLNTSLQELSNDLLLANLTEQSHLYNLLNNQALEMPGAYPFSVLMTDYPLFSIIENVQSQQLLAQLMTLAAKVLTPIVSPLHPAFFGIDQFSDLPPTEQLLATSQTPQQRIWEKLRTYPNSHFLSFLLPRVLLRPPYQQQASRPYFLAEETSSVDHYLWGSPIYYYAANLINSLQKTGVFSLIKGHDCAIKHPTRLPYGIDHSEFDTSLNTEVYITDMQEKYFADQGIIALCDKKFSKQLLFYSSVTFYQAKNQKDHYSYSQLQYTLLATRFAHYIKVIMRDKVGTFQTAQDCEYYLQQWILQYCAQHFDPASSVHYPLKSANIKISNPDNHTQYHCELYCQPHTEWQQLSIELKLSTSISLAIGQ